MNELFKDVTLLEEGKDEETDDLITYADYELSISNNEEHDEFSLIRFVKGLAYDEQVTIVLFVTYTYERFSEVVATSLLIDGQDFGLTYNFENIPAEIEFEYNESFALSADARLLDNHEREYDLVLFDQDYKEIKDEFIANLSEDSYSLYAGFLEIDQDLLYEIKVSQMKEVVEDTLEQEVTPSKDKVYIPPKSIEVPIKETDKVAWKRELIRNSIVGFETVYQDDPKLEKGQTKVISNGVNGKLEVSAEYKYVNGKRTQEYRNLVSKEIVKAVNQVVARGSKVAEAAKCSAAESSNRNQQMINEINKSRCFNGLANLAYSDGLAKAANIRANEIIKSFSHTRPDGSSWDTVSPLVYAENISYGHTSAIAAHTAFMNSAGHRANIVIAGFKTVGTSAVNGPNGTTYWVVLFGY
ncbi:MAG: hypothetical protein GX074_01395 [Erysipelothrix sp.]|nr:hypothetical protein [Erysipelothrix sp.]